MRLANVVQQLVSNKKLDATVGGTLSGPTIPYFKFSDFQRAVTNCTDPTSVILVCATPADAIPHCIAHTALIGLSAVLLNDEVAPASSASSSSSSTAMKTGPTAALNKTKSLLAKLSGGGGGATSIEGSKASASPLSSSSLATPANPLTDATSERSILDVSNVKAASAEQVLAALTRAAKAGTWVILPEVSALSLPVWTQIGRLLASCSNGSGSGGSSSSATTTSAVAVDSNILGGSSPFLDVNDASLDSSNISPHFRFVAFLTEKSSALGRTLSPKVAHAISVVDTRGVVRHHQELSALLSSVVPLTTKQLSLLCVGIGDGRAVEGPESSQTANAMLTTSFSTMTLAVGSASTLSASMAAGAALNRNQQQQGGDASSSPRGGSSAANRQNQLPSYFVDWPCAAAYANAPVTVHTSDSATTTDYVDGALFALRETLLRALKDLTQTATRLDQQHASARKLQLESRALRTGQDIAELEQLEEMKQMHAETNMTKLEKNPAWVYPHMHDWILSCAPMVNLEKLPCVSYEELTFDDILWLHEGVGDATTCLKGTWQLSPVCIKCALPSVRPDVTVKVNNRLIIEGRTLLSIRHPAIISVFGICELPSDLSTVQGGNMVLRPLLSAAVLHERWLDSQQDTTTASPGAAMAQSDNASTFSGADMTSTASPNASILRSALAGTTTTGGATTAAGAQQQQNQNAAPVKQFALLLEPFEMSIEQALVSAFDRNRPWMVGQFLDVCVSILLALVHISDLYVHRAVCPSSVVITSGAASLNQKHNKPSNNNNNSNNKNARNKLAKTTSSASASSKKSIQSEGERKDGGDDDEDDGIDNNDGECCDNADDDDENATAIGDAQSSAALATASVGALASSGERLVCKLAQFGALMPANKRVTPPWLVAVNAATMPVRYCAPETFWGQFSAASDIWSFGITLWAMLHYCRKQPYDGIVGVDCAGAISEGVSGGWLNLPRPGDQVPAVFWDVIIAPCLNRQPAARPNARALISTIMLVKVQHKALLGRCVEFEETGY